MLNSIFVIDGVRQELTPVQMLSALLAESATVSCGCSGNPDEIVDESLESPVISVPAAPELSFLKKISLPENPSRLPSFPDVSGRLAVATALLDALRCTGAFKLRDLALTFDCTWHCGDIGEGAAFYPLVSSVCEFADALGLQFSSVTSHQAGGGEHLFSIGTSLLPPACTDIPEMYRSQSPHISPFPACPDTVSPDPASWVAFIPFDSADPRLGGSRLADILGGEFDVAPQTGDADYFIDCFEVVRELIEDRVVMAARTVGRGGLLPSLDAFCGSNVTLETDFSDMIREPGDNALLRVLYAEIPGMLIQVRDLDFDYLDAELLLQEVVYYPLGHPSEQDGCRGVRLKSGGRSGIQTILESLLRNAEGED